MPYFPDFSQTIRLGFQTGMQMGEGQNPLGTFIKSMLADWQNKRQVAGEYEMKKGLIKAEADVFAEKERYKQELESATPEAQARTKYYQANADWLTKAGQGSDEGADLVYRRGATGETVPAAQAIGEIEQGNRDFTINQRRVGRSGVIETPISKPADLTEREKEYIITSKRIQKRLGGIQELVPEVRQKGYGELENFAVQSKRVPYIFLRDKTLKDLKSNIDSVKADIPFLRGGKQLTIEEGRRVDILLSPFGKSDEIYQRDIGQFQEEFILGERLMTEGITALNPIAVNKRKVTPEIAKQLFKEAGGDKARARTIAKQRGYIF